MERMDRLIRLFQLWSWLPAFRVVAETEHLPTASKQLGVSAPALSRTIHLLEDRVGEALFERRGRRLALSAAGQELLACVRDAMRRVDDGIDRVTAMEYRGPIRLSAPGAFASIFVVPVLERLQSRYSELVTHLVHVDRDRANAMLLEGTLDLALSDDPAPRPHLEITKLAGVRYGVYCGPGHPLYERANVSRDELASHAFVAPPEEVDDHWPSHWHRHVGVRVTQLQLGVEICAGGRFLATLPDVVAQGHHERGRLRRLPVRLPGNTALYLVRREPLGTRPLLDETVAELRAQVARSAEPK